MKHGIIESGTKAYLPKAFRPAAKIGANIVFKVYAPNWALWNQGIDTVMQLKEQLKTKFQGPRQVFYSSDSKVVRILNFKAV